MLDVKTQKLQKDLSRKKTEEKYCLYYPVLCRGLF